MTPEQAEAMFQRVWDMGSGVLEAAGERDAHTAVHRLQALITAAFDLGLRIGMEDEPTRRRIGITVGTPPKSREWLS